MNDQTETAGRESAVAKALWLHDGYDLNADPTGALARVFRPIYTARAAAVLAALDAATQPPRDLEVRTDAASGVAAALDTPPAPGDDERAALTEVERDALDEAWHLGMVHLGLNPEDYVNRDAAMDMIHDAARHLAARAHQPTPPNSNSGSNLEQAGSSPRPQPTPPEPTPPAKQVHYFDDRERGHRHALNSSCFETCPGYQPTPPAQAEAVAALDEVIDAIEETFLANLPSKALSYCAQEDVLAGLSAMRERFDTPEHRAGERS